ncbi:hypothetical protein HZB93_00820 [Candidatus Falkowbacteria bacterium]|nr:hypothetical protein [Candidatus Falkowbacteria bacterium]
MEALVKIVRVVMGIVVAVAYLYILLSFVKKYERRRLMVVGETGDGGDRVFPIMLFVAFVGTLLVLGE